LLSGCLVAKSELTASETEKRVLAEQNRAQAAELSNLKTHARDTEDQLMKAERELAALQEQYERNGGHLPAEGSMGMTRQLPASVSQQLSALSQRFPDLKYDASTGVSKLDLDVLFASGQSELTPSAKSLLAELAQVLQQPDARELKVMVVGHTDSQRIVAGSTREKYPNNFHLSTGRALAVADQLRTQGLAEGRLGVAGFAAHQPAVANDSSTNQQKNRRVEIFVIPPEVPVVGWTENGSNGYY
jgi:outer membrane protein OmpA-like peptidoglycan-associated protein